MVPQNQRSGRSKRKRSLNNTSDGEDDKGYSHEDLPSPITEVGKKRVRWEGNVDEDLEQSGSEDESQGSEKVN